MIVNAINIIIAGHAVQFDDNGIELLNELLSRYPVCEDKRINERWLQVPMPNHRLRVTPKVTVDAVLAKA